MFLIDRSISREQASERSASMQHGAGSGSLDAKVDGTIATMNPTRATTTNRDLLFCTISNSEDDRIQWIHKLTCNQTLQVWQTQCRIHCLKGMAKAS